MDDREYELKKYEIDKKEASKVEISGNIVWAIFWIMLIGGCTAVDITSKIIGG